MALDNYSNLKASIIAQSHRSDISPKVADFITLAETEMLANSTENLSVRDFETRSTADTGTTERFLALPDGFLKARRILLDDKSTNANQFETRYRTPETLPISSRTGTPEYFTVTSQIEFNRIPDVVYNVEVQYFAEFTPLSDANPVNSILTSNPNIYLFGAMWALKQYTVELDESEYYYGKFLSAIMGANARSEEGRYGPAPYIMTEGVIV